MYVWLSFERTLRQFSNPGNTFCHHGPSPPTPHSPKVHILLIADYFTDVDLILITFLILYLILFIRLTIITSSSSHGPIKRFERHSSRETCLISNISRSVIGQYQCLLESQSSPIICKLRA